MTLLKKIKVCSVKNYKMSRAKWDFLNQSQVSGF